MLRKMKGLLALTLMLLAVCAVCCATADAPYRDLTVGSVGDDVLAMKQRLYELKYYSTTKLTNTFNDAVGKVVRTFQKSNGLEQTGVATAYTQAVLFSDAAVNAKGAAKDASAAIADAGVYGDGRYRDIGENASGDDVLALKERLYDLGLYDAKSGLSNKYNADMAQRISRFQAMNGLPETGVMTADEQALAYSAQAKGEPTPTPKPTATPKPTKVPKPTIAPQAEVALPALNDSGFLADENAAPFIYENRDDGHWYYIAQDLFVEVSRYTEPSGPLVYFITDVRTNPDKEPIRSLLTEGSLDPGHNFSDPITISEKSKAILSITDDNYGYRWYRRVRRKMMQYQLGVVIRDFDVKSDAAPTADYEKFPALDIMAYYPDGKIELFAAREHTAQEYLDMGVMSTWSFGPILVRDGAINQELYDQSKAHYAEHAADEPRMAMGYYEPGHYVILTVNGRTDDSDGESLFWMAQKMLDMGIPQCFNLDGGGTTTLCFMGEAINRKPGVNRESIRDVSSMIAFGTIE